MENAEVIMGNGEFKPVEDKSSLLDKAVIVSFKTGWPGNSRKVKGKQQILDTDADKDLLRVNKELLDSPELKEIVSFANKSRRWVLSLCVPSFIEEGYYFAPIARLAEIDAGLAEREKAYWDMVDMFVGVYPDRVREMSSRLWSLFNPEEYPGVSGSKPNGEWLLEIDATAIKSLFLWRVRYVSFGVPDSLKSLSADLYRRERDRFEQSLVEASNEVQNALREAFSGLVSHMVKKLTETRDNGKPGIFRDSLITNLTAFIDTFRDRNLTSDAVLEELVGQAKALLSGVTPDVLRDNTGLRNRVQTGFEQIKEQISLNLIDRPTRSFSFDD